MDAFVPAVSVQVLPAVSVQGLSSNTSKVPYMSIGMCNSVQCTLVQHGFQFDLHIMHIYSYTACGRGVYL